ncbi:MAG TPA: collagen-binding domain-containing protein [Polyangiales bacterium]|nr:collagen-binding domain-containing protein [Polyangiales bacterium]
MDLITNSPLEVSSADAAGASVAVNNELRLGPETSIDGSLYVSGHYGAASAPAIGGSFERNAAPRCACDSKKFLDISGMISARTRDNDNANALLTPTSLSGFDGGRSLTLDCGRYFFDRIAGNGLLQIDVRGRVALFVARDLALDDGFRLTLQPGATAEIYVGGNVLVRGKLDLGASNGGGRVLLAVQDSGTIDVADSYIDGSIYAPYETLTTRGAFELHGSLFVNRANFGAPATIRYARAVAVQPRCQ